VIGKVIYHCLKKYTKDRNLFYTEHMIYQIIYTVILMALVFFITRSFYKKEIKSLTLKDRRTGIYNRSYFDHVYMSEFHRARRINHPISLIFIKSDRSIEVAEKLIESIQRDTDFIAQYEEELYVAVLYDTDSNGTDKVINRILESRPYDHNLNIGVYAGVPDNHISSRYMLEAGMKALEKSIKNGKNCVEFSLDSV
jgi:GGDEF domain-containing protein